MCLLAVPLAAGLLLAASCSRNAPEPAVAQPEASGLRRLSAAGTPEEVGRSIGGELAPEIRKMHALFLRVAEVSTLQGKRTLYERAAALGQQLCEDDRAELRGLGEASGVGYQAAHRIQLLVAGENERALASLAAFRVLLLHLVNELPH